MVHMGIARAFMVSAGVARTSAGVARTSAGGCLPLWLAWVSCASVAPHCARAVVLGSSPPGFVGGSFPFLTNQTFPQDASGAPVVAHWCRVPWALANPLCDIPSGCCSFTGPWTVTRSSLRMLRRGAVLCRPLRPVLLRVSFPRLRSPVVGVLGLCWMWQDVPFGRQRRPIIGVLGVVLVVAGVP